MVLFHIVCFFKGDDILKVYIIDEGIDRMGGVERVVSVLANEFVTHFDKVEVISEFKSSNKPFYDYNENVDFTYLISHIDKFVNKISKKSVLFYLLKLFERIIKKTILPIKIKKTIKKVNNSDVVIFARVQVALDFLPAFQKLNLNPKVIVRDAATLECLSKNEKYKFKKYFPKFVDKFIVSSDESMKNYRNFFKNASIDMVKIYNPLGIVPNIGYNYNSKKIISIGRLHPQKGFDSLIRSFALIADRYPDWTLEIYGSGREEKNLKKIISNYNLNEKVLIKKSTKNVVKLFNSSSIFVLPSRYEGYANVLVEAMSCGIPCITYDWISGANEIIKNGTNGIIVKLKDKNKYFSGARDLEDEKKLASAMEKLVNNPSLCEKYSLLSSNIIKTRNTSSIIENWISIIEEYH